MTMTPHHAVMLKKAVRRAIPRARPLKDGEREYFIVRLCAEDFTNLKQDRQIMELDKLRKEMIAKGKDFGSTYFEEGNLMYNGMIFKECGEKTRGDSNEPVFVAANGIFWPKIVYECAVELDKGMDDYWSLEIKAKLKANAAV